jgi:hypothetical protein
VPAGIEGLSNASRSMERTGACDPLLFFAALI